MQIYSGTFNCKPFSSKRPFSIMLQNYELQFKAIHESLIKKIDSYMMGSKFHEIVKINLKVYEESQKRKLSASFRELDETEQQKINQAKRDSALFIDGVVKVLNEQFRQTSVTVNSSMNAKLEFVGRLTQELEKGYSNDADLKHFVKQS